MKCCTDYEICILKNRKHYGKRRKGWLPAFSSFPTTFSEVLFSWSYLNLELCVNPLPNNIFLDRIKFKAFADDNFNIAKTIVSILNRV